MRCANSSIPFWRETQSEIELSIIMEGQECETETGGRKKFLYSGPVNNRRPEDDEWSFVPKSTSHNPSPRAGVPVDLDNVWSIRNVSLGNNNTATSVRSEPVSFKPEVLTKTTNSSFYSRHGGMNGRTGSPKVNNQENSNAEKASPWSSSGHKLAPTSQRLHPPTFQNPSEKAFKNSRSRRQNPSPFDYDMNDF